LIKIVHLLHVSACDCVIISTIQLSAEKRRSATTQNCIVAYNLPQNSKQAALQKNIAPRHATPRHAKCNKQYHRGKTAPTVTAKHENRNLMKVFIDMF